MDLVDNFKSLQFRVFKWLVSNQVCQLKYRTICEDSHLNLWLSIQEKDEENHGKTSNEEEEIE